MNAHCGDGLLSLDTYDKHSIKKWMTEMWNTFYKDKYYYQHSTSSTALWIKLCIFMKSTRLDSFIMFGTGLCLDWRKARVIRSFRVKKKNRLPPTLYSLLLHTLLQTLPFLRFINSIKPVLGSLVVMGCSVWVAAVTDNFFHTFREKKLLSEDEKVPLYESPTWKNWALQRLTYSGQYL